MKKIVGSTLDLITKAVFSMDKYQLKIWVENSVFATQHIENRKSFTEVLSLRDQTNPFAYSCSFTFHTSYKNGMFGHGGAGGAVKMLKNTLLKKLIRNLFCKNL